VTAGEALDVLDARFASNDEREQAAVVLRAVVDAATEAVGRSAHLPMLRRLRDALDGRGVQ